MISDKRLSVRLPLQIEYVNMRFKTNFSLCILSCHKDAKLARLTFQIRWAYLIKWEWWNDNIFIILFQNTFLV